MFRQSGGLVKNLYLFHGTKKEHVDSISHQGFDWRLSGLSSAARYGRGSYFSPTLNYSLKFAPDGWVFLAHVLVGEYTVGKPEYLRPPHRENSQYVMYDSCVDNCDNPQRYVIFSQDQAYPSYLVQLEHIK